MNKKYKIGSILFVIALIAILFGSVSCETDYVDHFTTVVGDTIQVPDYTHIESFVVDGADDGQTVSAAITQDSIVVVWSAYRTLPDSIAPVIVLAEGATIVPASGVNVRFETGTVYTVTSQTGTVKDYTLKIDIRQQVPTWAATGHGLYYKGALSKVVNTGIVGEIDNLLPDISQTRVYFVSAADQTTEYDAEVVHVGYSTGELPFNEYGIYFFLPDNMPAGMYDMRIQNGQYTLVNPNADERFQDEVANLATFSTTKYGFPVTKNAGDTFEVRGTGIDQLTSVEIYSSIDTGTVYPLEIVTATPYRAMLKLPTNIPAGVYDKMRFTRADGTSDEDYPVTIQ